MKFARLSSQVDRHSFAWGRPIRRTNACGLTGWDCHATHCRYLFIGTGRPPDDERSRHTRSASVIARPGRRTLECESTATLFFEASEAHERLTIAVRWITQFALGRKTRLRQAVIVARVTWLPPRDDRQATTCHIRAQSSTPNSHLKERVARAFSQNTPSCPVCYSFALKRRLV